jgi:purine-nucleoside phosphorylase
MPRPSVHGHDGQLVCGRIGTTDVACLSGRAHLYEGHSPERVVFGVRLLAALGVNTVLLTNAAGGITPACGAGTLMLITDHINLTGRSPLLGPNDERWGPRFPDMSAAYSPRLREITKRVARSEGVALEEGVYAGVLGPSYETPAEVTMLERMGASAVGMSTVVETIALRHQDVEVVGISCITNPAAGKGDGKLSHEEVAEVAAQTSDEFVRLVSAIIPEFT